MTLIDHLKQGFKNWKLEKEQAKKKKAESNPDIIYEMLDAILKDQNVYMLATKSRTGSTIVLYKDFSGAIRFDKTDEAVILDDTLTVKYI